MAPWTGWTWNGSWKGKKKQSAQKEVMTDEMREAISAMKRLCEVRKAQGQHEVRGNKLVIPELEKKRKSRKSRGSRRSRRSSPSEKPEVEVEAVEEFVEVEEPKLKLVEVPQEEPYKEYRPYTESSSQNKRGGNRRYNRGRSGRNWSWNGQENQGYDQNESWGYGNWGGNWGQGSWGGSWKASGNYSRSKCV